MLLNNKFLFCCCCFGMCAIKYSVQARHLFKKNGKESIGGKNKSSIALRLNIAGVCFGICSIVTYIIFLIKAFTK